MRMTKELWARLDEIDGKTIVQGAELKSWRYECRWQAQNHPDGEIRTMFENASTRENLTRKEARALAVLAHVE